MTTRRTSRWVACALIVLGGLAASSQARATEHYDLSLDRALESAQSEIVRSTRLWEDHSSWENAWRVRTKHYEVVTTHSYFYGHAIAQGLEAMLGHFKALLSPEFETGERFLIYVCPTLEAYNAYGEQAAEHSSFYGSFYAEQETGLPVVVLFTENWLMLNMWITHSAVHQFLRRAFPQQQPAAWVSEGLASYFALFWDFDYGNSELQRIIRNQPAQRNLSPGPGGQEFIALENLLTTDTPGYLDRTHNRLIEIGMLFSYLLAFNEDTRTVVEDGAEVRAPFADYLRAILTGGNYGGMFIHNYLTDHLGEIEEAFKAHEFE